MSHHFNPFSSDFHSDTYDSFIFSKSQLSGEFGFKPLWMPDFLFDFQHHLVDWAIRKGRAAIFADCGLGKTAMQLVYAQNILLRENKSVLILTPLAVGQQTMREGDKFDIPCTISRDGRLSGPGIYISNYERLHYFDPSYFCGIVCDESGILKNVSNVTKKEVLRFSSRIPYRLLCTATPSPNDYTELGNSSEVLGNLTYSDMISRFFVQVQNKNKALMDATKNSNRNHFAKLAYRVSQQIGNWRMKAHAEPYFWRWISSWARACRMPSDLGFSDEKFILPPLYEKHHVITPNSAPDDMLFTLPVFGLKEERHERKRTIQQRSEYVAELVNHEHQAVVWCHLNPEGDLLEKLIPDSVQVKGSMKDDAKIEAFEAFASGDARVMVIKPKIGAWGLNWQHCNHVVTYPSHSYESHYQSIRRCWRFGQLNPVTVDIVSTKGEEYVKDNMIRKSHAAEEMFKQLVAYMNDEISLMPQGYDNQMEPPTWVY